MSDFDQEALITEANGSFDPPPPVQHARPMPEPTLVEYKGGPVYLYRPEGYHADARTAAEALYDDGIDPATVVAHPCAVMKAQTPCLIEVIEEAWNADFEDDYNHEVPKPLAAILSGVQTLLEKAAPDVWMPRIQERIELPPVMGGMIAT